MLVMQAKASMIRLKYTEIDDIGPSNARRQLSLEWHTDNPWSSDEDVIEHAGQVNMCAQEILNVQNHVVVEPAGQVEHVVDTRKEQIHDLMDDIAFTNYFLSGRDVEETRIDVNDIRKDADETGRDVDEDTGSGDDDVTRSDDDTGSDSDYIVDKDNMHEDGALNETTELDIDAFDSVSEDDNDTPLQRGLKKLR
ncbi:hypothetical protein QVD17_16624 [Tagetes erecta]|uniref:Uncharacterized protein n=1 Tax=Tagetes erecta TaxID=13708 RepID=A0AAD8KVD1_TARER|nr:hypothetical protein QVD17_16624 [Tagetes erecta]